MDLASLGLSAVLYFGFVAVLFAGSILMPGALRAGAKLPNGSSRVYKLNGLRLFLVVIVAVAATTLLRPNLLAVPVSLAFPLFVVANAFAVVLTVALDATAGPSGNRGPSGMVRDLWMGREVNPTLLGVDLKMFSYRPSLIGLWLLDVALAAEQYRRHGFVSTRMGLYQAGKLLYVFNYFQFEQGMLFTWDVVAERFGGMLVWGDYVLVPFFYSLIGWSLLDRTDPLPAASVAGLVALYVAGFVMFRGANGQKHRFKTDPKGPIWGRPPEALGGRLLVSGFWGIGRKLNYTGEVCMYLAWALTCGTGSFMPYLLPLWLGALLAHRAWRDDRRCREKYGALWTAYCRRARFRMIPFLY